MVQRSYILLVPLFLTACTATTSVTPTANLIPSPAPTVSTLTETPEPGSSSTPFPTNVRIEDDEEYRIPPMLGFDAIPPVYDPRFVSAQESPLLDEELVMGVALDGKAKAYSVSVLRSREMVNDEIAGWPVLVTW